MDLKDEFEALRREIKEDFEKLHEKVNSSMRLIEKVNARVMSEIGGDGTEGNINRSVREYNERWKSDMVKIKDIVQGGAGRMGVQTKCEIMWKVHWAILFMGGTVFGMCVKHFGEKILGG